MSRTARFTTTSSLAALGALTLAFAAQAAEPPAAKAPAPPAVMEVVGYVPAADAGIDAALRRGIERGLKGAAVGLRLCVGGRPTQWSNAGPEAVRLVFREGAKVLISPPDRRVAHLMAQVATRVRVPMISTCAVGSVGQTGSTFVHGVAGPKDVPGVATAADWERLGYRAARRAAEEVAARTRDG